MKSTILFHPLFVPGSFAAGLSANATTATTATTAPTNYNDHFSPLIPISMTRPPKLLPWIARKAGISGERAQEIWRESVRYAMRQIESTGKPDYSRIVMERLRKLVEQEKFVALAGQPDSRIA